MTIDLVALKIRRSNLVRRLVLRKVAIKDESPRAHSARCKIHAGRIYVNYCSKDHRESVDKEFHENKGAQDGFEHDIQAQLTYDYEDARHWKAELDNTSPYTKLNMTINDVLPSSPAGPHEEQTVTDMYHHRRFQLLPARFNQCSFGSKSWSKLPCMRVDHSHQSRVEEGCWFASISCNRWQKLRRC